LDHPAQVAQPLVDAEIVLDVVAVVPVGAGVEGHQPQAGDAQVGQVVDPPGQTLQVAHPVPVGAEKGLHVEAVDDGALPPQVAGVGDPHTSPSPVLGVQLNRDCGDRRHIWSKFSDVVLCDNAACATNGSPGKSLGNQPQQQGCSIWLQSGVP